MKTDFNIVKRQVIGEYLKLYGGDRKGQQWSMLDCLNVFRYYYALYKLTFGEDHPKLSNKTIQRIIADFPRTNDIYEYEFEPKDYPAMIKAYFNTGFEGCDYSIAHFMSGNIRTMRFYEELY